MMEPLDRTEPQTPTWPKPDPSKKPVFHTVKIVLHETPTGVKVTTVPSFQKLAAKAAARKMSPAEAYAWVAMKAIREQSQRTAAEALERSQPKGESIETSTVDPDFV